jgi:hypothetical protein
MRLITLLLVFATIGLGASAPPVESSLGQTPTPPVVAMTGAPGTGGDEESPAVEPTTLIELAFKQGGLTLVCLVLIGVLYRELRTAKEDKKILLDAIDHNSAALTKASEAHHRLARALEMKGTV